jgi:hypothetical protein
MASALCPHEWPWFEECPFCLGAPVEQDFELSLLGRPVVFGVGHMVRFDLQAFRFEGPVFRFTYGVGQRGERVLVGAVNSDGGKIP